MNSMDFLKACATNIRLVEGVLDWHYIRYVCQDPTQKRLPTTAIELRRSNIICTSKANSLWVFVAPDDEPLETVSLEKQQLVVQERGTVREGSFVGTDDGNNMHKIALEAIECSITYVLTTAHAMLHVGYFEWLLNMHTDDATPANGGAIVKMHPRITEAGSLYISITTRVSALSPLSRTGGAPVGHAVLAPSGVKAKLITRSDDEHLISNTTSHTIKGPTWEREVSEVLMSESIEIQYNEQWYIVELVDSGHSERFTWPARLCLVPSRSHERDTSSTDSTWQYWFDISDDSRNIYAEPLAAAEEWCSEVAERERAADAGSVGDMPTVDATNSTTVVAETPMATSPPFNQRLVDQQAALAGIYPTPPDGLVPGHMPIYLTSDSLSSAMQVDPTSVGEDSELPVNEGNTGRGNSMESAGEEGTYEPQSDDLFGDMAEMDFATNEVGDEDFDYFDEPDEDDVDGGNTRDVEMVGRDNQDNVAITPAQPEVADFADVGATPSASCPGPPNTAPPSDYTASVPESPALERKPSPQQSDPVLHIPIATPAQPCPPPPEKPLSPFGIKERLLPPPIPASMLPSYGPPSQPHQRSSTFDPVHFNESLLSSDRYQSAYKPQAGHPTIGPNISLPSKAKKERSKSSTDFEFADTDVDSSSEDESSDSMTSVGEDEDLPPKLPWETKKRKRAPLQEQIRSTENNDRFGLEEASHPEQESSHDTDQMQHLIATILRGNLVEKKGASRTTRSDEYRFPAASAKILHFSGVLELAKPELVYVAQYLCEQATTSTLAIKTALANVNQTYEWLGSGTQSSLVTAAYHALDHTLPAVQDCGLAKLALVKEPPPRPVANNGKAQAAGQPRMPYREGSMHLGPDYFPLPPSFVRIQRGSDSWEMLPPAVNFWAALSLGPANGPKDINLICVAPNNLGLMSPVRGFARDLASTYENCKLGQLNVEPVIAFHDANIEGEDQNTHYEDGIVRVGDTMEGSSLESAMQEYRVVFEQLGKAIEPLGRESPERSTVICIVDPFEDGRATQFLCACFWRLFAYCRRSTPKALQKAQRSDVVLQIIPISLMASRDGLVVLDHAQLCSVAMEVYDRCPPSPKAAAMSDVGSALSIMAAPAVELSAGAPKRIAFQLSSEPPSDLLHENSILHLAYTLSPDRQWLTICWVDSTGRYQMTYTTCLRGRSFKDAAAEVWDRLCEIMAAREVTWRVFIVSNAHISPSIRRCWRALAVSKIRKQMLHVTLLSAEDDPPIHLIPPPPAEGSNAAGQQAGQGFLTPVSTPQGGSMTVSPDASGIANQNATTPVSAEATATTSENDPDAHLIDISDESWGMLLSPSLTSDSSSLSPLGSSPTTAARDPVTKGILFRRGNAALAGSDKALDALAVSLHWDIRVRPGGAVDEGPPRQAEMTLREVLRMYRNLGLLARLRNLGGEDDGSLTPLHIACAARGAKALDGFLES